MAVLEIINSLSPIRRWAFSISESAKSYESPFIRPLINLSFQLEHSAVLFILHWERSILRDGVGTHCEGDSLCGCHSH